MFLTSIPIIISVLFLIAITIAIFMIGKLAKKGGQKRVFQKVIIFYTCYLSIVAVACFQGMFDVVSLPPRIVVLTTLPLLIFLIGFVFNTRFYKKSLKNIQLPDLVKLHIFRLIGSFFLILMAYQLLPKPFALIAGIGDVTTAISSLFVADALIKKKSYAKKLTVFWNTFGLLDILLTSFMAILFTKWNIETGSLGVDVLTKFPFCFIPAFAPATIIFLHLSIYRKVFFEKH